MPYSSKYENLSFTIIEESYKSTAYLEILICNNKGTEICVKI